MARTAKEKTISYIPEEKQPFSLPNNWCWVSVECINQYTSVSIDPAKQPETIFELYSVPSSADNYPEIVSGEDIGSTKQAVEKGDVLLCKINPCINRVWKVSQHTDYALLASSEWIIIRNSLINSDYLMYCFRSPYFRDYMLSNVSGVGGSLMRAQPKYVKEYPVPIPPLAEQQRIVDRIESLFAKLDEAKEKAQAVVDGFENRKAAILHKAFTGELTEVQRKKRGVGLDSWEPVTLKEIVSGFKYGTSEKSDYSFAGMPVLRIPNIGDDGIDFSDIKNLSSETVEATNQIHENDILIIRSNGSRDLVGKCALVPQLDQEYAYASFLIRIKPSERVKAEYLVQFLNSTDARAQMFAKAKSSAGINNINSKELGAILLKLPELWEQEEIFRQVSKLLLLEKQAKETAEQVIGQIDIMKKAILARAFRGELGTNDSTDESAEELLKRDL
ncbi:MAG: restriction endonuclease subunit S [Eubacterium sp.]|nr:restriction endonuclease subunit S [Eubacterium sp.]